MKTTEITPQIIEQLGLTPEEYDRIKSVLKREPNINELGVLGWVANVGAVVVGVILIVFCLGIFVSGQGGLVYGVSSIEGHGKYKISQLFHHGRKRVVRLLIINVIKGVAVALLLYLTGLMIHFVGGYGVFSKEGRGK